VGEQSPAPVKPIRGVEMRSREEIDKATSFPEHKMLEVLLDIRELLTKKEVKKRGRPRRRINASGK